jgi:peptide/nickel transport system substrate-binding protein
MITKRLLALAAAFGLWAQIHAPDALASDELRLGVKLPLTTMDPHFFATFATASAHASIWERLVELDPDGQPVPALAESWRLEDDLTWEFVLRPGVRFHDGTALTAADVVWSFQRIRDVQRSPSSFARYIAGVRAEAVDARRVRLVTDRPKPLLPFDLAYVMIGSSRTPDGAGVETFNAGQHVNGTGPYRFAGWTANESLTLERHDGHWAGPAPWRRIVERTIADDAARGAALLAGDVDAINALAPSAIEGLRGRPGIAVALAPSTTTLAIALDLVRADTPFVQTRDGGRPARNPLADARVRRALSLAIPRDAIAERVMAGAALPAAQLSAPRLHGAVADAVPDPHDPAAALALLREAGWGEGFRATIHVDANGFLREPAVAQAIAQSWARIGVIAEVQSLPAAVFLTRAGRQEFSIVLAAQGGINAGVSLRSMVASWDERAGRGLTNRMRYANAALDDLIERAIATTDGRARIAQFHAANAIVAAEAPVLPIFHAANAAASRTNVAMTLWPDRRFNALMMRPGSR